MQKLTLTIVFLSVLRLVGLSQEERQYTFVHYGTDNGLAAYEVRAIEQDETGYMWIGTVTGLQRFDGARFITFYHRKNDSTSIPDNHIVQLLLDKKNNLWVLTASGRLGIFDTKHFRFKEVAVKPVKQGSLLADKKLVLNSQGNIFLICHRSELLAYNETNNRFSADHIIPLPPKWSIISFCEKAAERKYYIGTDSGLVVYNAATKMLSYAGHNVEKEPVINQWGHIPFVAPKLLDSKQRLWFISWPPTVGGPTFYCYNLHTSAIVLKEYSFLPLVKEYHEPNTMIQQKNGVVWIKGSKLFARYLEKENTFQLVHNGYVNDQSIAFGLVHDLYEDREENLWVATNNNGLYRFNPSKEYFLNVRHVNRAKNTPGEGGALTFTADNNGTILMGAWGNGIYRYDSSFNNIPVNIQGIIEKNSVVVWNMHPSRDGRTVWMGTQPAGIYQYDKISKKATYYDVPALEHSTVRQVCEDKYGNLWLGTHTKGLFKYTKTTPGVNFNKNVEKIAAVEAGTITALCTDPEGNLWVATTSNGVYVIDVHNNQVVHHFTAGEGPLHQRLPGNEAMSLYVYNDTTIFIGAGGLNVYNPRTRIIKQLHFPANMPKKVCAMQKDRNGYLWFTQSTGIIRFSPDNEKIYIVFDRMDGIINDQFEEGASACLPDGRLVFGCTNQFIVFNPQNIDLSDSLPDVSITGFKVRDQSLSVDSLLRLQFIELPPDQNSITIDLSALTYLSASIIKYKLENIDNDWVHTDLSSQASYSYLPPGTYTFMAKTEDSEGKPGKNITTFILKVKPHFWQTWWFFGLVVFAALGIFLWVDKMRMQKIKATESVRSRIATSLTEDMSNSLSSINITSELAKTKVDTDKERTREYINQISDASNRMVQAMYDMVWSIHPDNDSLLHTVERMKHYAADLETQYDADIIFQVDEHATDIRLPMEARYEMLSIFKEAVNNAAKHAQAKYIEVSIRYKKPSLTLCIRDDGKGFDVELVELSRGLTEMRRRAGTINAKLILKSEINTGTTVKLTIG